MQVSFTGIQNVSGFIDHFPKFPDSRKLVVQLTNEGDKDLDEFKDVFEKFQDPLKKGFLRIESLIIERGYETFSINGKPLFLKDANMPVFEKISKLLSKITGNKEGFKLEDKYLDSTDCSFNIVGARTTKINAEGKKFIKDSHLTSSVRLKAFEINKDIQNTMADYFQTSNKSRLVKGVEI